MKVSVIIVNNNMRRALRNALNALADAGKYVDYEVIISDNASSDGSLEMLRDEFPQYHIITGETNEGYSRACNKAIARAKGEYILLVSPHIISSKKTLERAAEFMDMHTDAGGLGVRMITPQGRFLPESNRGLTPDWISFFKLTGLAKYFPKSRLYDRNRKEWVEEFQTSEIDVINGDFMLLRKSVLKETGLFDERFFICGHDIDLSYRIRLAGFKNYYFPKTFVINFKQEKVKFNWKNLKYYYGAMFIFAAKYIFRMPEIKLQGIPQLT